MRGLTKPVDVTKPEDYQLRNGDKVIALAKYQSGDIYIVYDDAGEPAHMRVSPKGYSVFRLSSHDLIEKPKKTWRNLYKTYGGTLWFDSKKGAAFAAKNAPDHIGYITFTDQDDFSTYELAPLEGG